MAMAMAKKQGENNFWRKLRHKGGCCCFGWAVYAPWVCYMDIWALYNPNTPKCALTCQADLVADPQIKTKGGQHLLSRPKYKAGAFTHNPTTTTTAHATEK